MKQGALLCFLRLNVSPKDLSIWFLSPHNAEIADERCGGSLDAAASTRERQMGLSIMDTSKTELASLGYAMGNLDFWERGQHTSLRSHQIN